MTTTLLYPRRAPSPTTSAITTATHKADAIDEQADLINTACQADPTRYPGFAGIIVVDGDWAWVHRAPGVSGRRTFLLHGSLGEFASRAFGLGGRLRAVGTGVDGVKYYAVLKGGN